MSSATVLVAGAAATWAMVGLIWLIQIVHYPMLVLYSEGVPATALANHQRRIAWVVVPLMAIEAVTALILLFDQPETMSSGAAWVAAGLIALALLSTATVQVPLHRRLAEGHEPRVARSLVST
ncbi:MAG: hypothetical protein ACR2N9_05825, partial [Acidimicrobiia bacterium]